MALSCHGLLIIDLMAALRFIASELSRSHCYPRREPRIRDRSQTVDMQRLNDLSIATISKTTKQLLQFVARNTTRSFDLQVASRAVARFLALQIRRFGDFHFKQYLCDKDFNLNFRRFLKCKCGEFKRKAILKLINSVAWVAIAGETDG